MPRKGQYGDTTQRCAYCGKPELSAFWSMNSPVAKRHYCSFECSARDNQTCNLGCALCILPLTLVLSIGLALNIISPNPIDGTYFVVYCLVLLLQIIMAYSAYIGRR